MNYKRILAGGLIAGLTINVLDLLVMLFATGEMYEKFQSKGLFLKDPRLPFAPLWILGMFAIGILLAWFYAAARPRLGSGPGTALMVSFALALLIHVPYNFSQACWGSTGRLLPFVQMAAGILEIVIAGYFAAWIYKEKK